MTRDVICNVTNMTSFSIPTPTFDLQHGSASNNANPVPIPANCTNYQVFQFQKTTMSTFGVTGSCSYTLPDNSVLLIAFNCPFEQAGIAGPSNCWFYAGIQLAKGSSGTNYYVTCIATIDGQPLFENPFQPSNGSNIVGNITLYSL